MDHNELSCGGKIPGTGGQHELLMLLDFNQVMATKMVTTHYPG